MGKDKKCKNCKWFTWACPNWMCMNPKHPDYEEDSDYPVFVYGNDVCNLFERKRGFIMAIEIGEMVKAVHMDGEIIEGMLTSVLLGVDNDNRTKASITIEDKSTDTQVMLWCDGLKDIERIDKSFKDDNIVVIDPEKEYKELMKDLMSAEQITINPDSMTFLNPLDIPDNFEHAITLGRVGRAKKNKTVPYREFDFSLLPNGWESIERFTDNQGVEQVMFWYEL